MISLPALSTDEKIALSRKLIDAASRGSLREVRELHEAGADVNFSEGHTTPLAAASSRYERFRKTANIARMSVPMGMELDFLQHAKVIQYLMNNGADFDQQTPETKLAVRQALKEVS